MLWASFLTVSITILASLVLAALAVYIRLNKHTLKLLLLPLIVVVFLNLLTTFSWTAIEIGYNSPISYFQEKFMAQASDELQKYNFLDLIAR